MAHRISRVSAAMFCRRCGQENQDDVVRCVSCGEQLRDPAAPRYVVDTELGGLVPYKNAQALWAYYLGVFSLLPLFGIFLGIAAAFLGVRGLGFVRRHPEAKGRVHAWVGIVAGSCFAALQLAFIAVLQFL